MSDTAGIVFLVGRILFAFFFATAGVGHFSRGEMMAGYARSRGFWLAGAASWPAGVWLVLGVLSVVLGVWPDIGALSLAAFAILTAGGVHSFWRETEAAQRLTELQNFSRNMTFIGAALALFAAFAALGPRVPYVIVPPLIRF